MSHCRVLFIGTISNLDKIYADCPDSSSESEAEMAFGYDYLTEIPKDIFLGKKDIHGYFFHDAEACEFTKKDIDLYNKIVIGKLYNDCFDIRDNTSNHRLDWELDTEEEIEEFFKNLPEDTHFFVCSGHL